MIKAEIVADSVAPSNSRLTTFVLTYPRFIHSEFMTHRMFSRNASSSRAIPVKRQIEMVSENPAMPLAFTKNKAGMQGGDPLDGKAAELAEKIWMMAAFHAMDKAKILMDLGVHKQYANRLLEPFAHITVVCTATEFANFFALRRHPAAQPEIQELANLMWQQYESNQPKIVAESEPHLPFVSDETLEAAKAADDCVDQILNCFKMSVARCARVSYLNHEGKNPTLDEDLQLYNRLLGQVPIHASPAEHQAWAMTDPNFQSGNFRGWEQYRKTLSNENITEFVK
jgi:thymidylate synthase ThyX